MPIEFYEVQASMSLLPITFHEVLSDGVTLGAALQFSDTGELDVPDPPTLHLESATVDPTTLLTRTSAEWNWDAPTDGAVVTGYEVWRDGVFVAAVTEQVLTYTETGLPTATPELIFLLQVRAIGVYGPGSFSNSVAVQWNGTPTQPPSPPTSLTWTNLTATSVTLNWLETPPTGAAIAGRRVRSGAGTLMKDIAADVRTTSLTGLIEQTPYSGIHVTRYDVDGLESGPSNTVSFTTPPSGGVSFTMLTGISVPNSGKAILLYPLHGGYTQWDCVRTYQFGNAIGDFNEFTPLVIALTDSGTGIHSGASGATALRNFLINFYEGSGSAARQNCQIHYANGNEYATDVTNQTTFADTVHRMFDVCHEEISPGVRRFPNAYMGLDPTHDQEFNGIVSTSLMPVAQWLDFIAWSMYPPGREQTSDDPTFTKPGINTGVRATDFLDRCFRRVVAARDRKRTDTGNPNADIWIECWEVGIGDDPGTDAQFGKEHRPYYTANTLCKWPYERAIALDLKMPVWLWWNQEVAQAGQSQNRLADEPSTTNPSTATALRNWQSFLPEYGGTKPASWPTPAQFATLVSGGSPIWKGGA